MFGGFFVCFLHAPSINCRNTHGYVQAPAHWQRKLCGVWNKVKGGEGELCFFYQIGYKVRKIIPKYDYNDDALV